ncbi:sensor histidine kinase [Verrucomicrobiota bacterium sgz303538]
MDVPLDCFALTVTRHVHKMAVGLAIAIGAFVLAGWAVAVARMYSPLLSFGQMSPHTALAFLLAGVSLWLWREPLDGQRKYYARGCGAAVGVLGILSSIKSLVDWSFGFDVPSVLSDPFEFLIAPEFQMAPNTALSISLVGGALFAFEYRTSRENIPAEWLALASAFIPFTAVVGYIYDVRGFISPFADESSPAAMSVHTAAGLLALCIAILTARSERGWMARFMSQSPEGLIARKLLPWGIVTLLALGWLSKTGEQIGLYDHYYEAAILVALSALALVFFLRHSMNALAALESRRQQVEANFQKSEERLRRALEAAHLGAWERDLKTNTIQWSEALEDIFGLHRGSFDGRFENLLKLIHSDDREMVQVCLDRVIKGTERSYCIDYRICWPDGSVRWLAARGNTMRDKNGEPVSLAGTVVDITERKLLERELIEASNREQRRLGQDLHDDIGQWLTAIHLESRALLLRLQSKSEADAAQAEKIASNAREALERTRMLARGMMPAVIESGGLAAALRELAANSERIFDARCNCHCEEVAVRDPEAALQLYRIAQEAISNAIRHGKATEVLVYLEALEDSRARLVIRDNGHGIRLPLPRNSGLGLRIMQYRAGLLGAHVDIHPVESGGTEVVCSFSKTL